MRKARRAAEVLREEGIRSLFRRATLFGTNAIGSSLAAGIQRLNRGRYGLTGAETRVMDENWDNLILLDACRYDQFDRLHTVSGTLESRISLGSATPEFLENNFEGTTHHDTVYVTANPMYRTLNLADTFHAVVDVWEHAWDEQLNTVPPEPMAEATETAHGTYPNKRILAHFMQPHYPFIGDTGKRIPHSGYERTYRMAKTGDGSRDNPQVWDLVWSGDIGEDIVRRAYDENLELVLTHVGNLLGSLEGLTVITSDHGNLLGERIAPFDGPRYGHPPEVYVDELRKVPWFVVDHNTRKRITNESPTEPAGLDSTSVTDRLADLGYVDR